MLTIIFQYRIMPMLPDLISFILLKSPKLTQNDILSFGASFLFQSVNSEHLASWVGTALTGA